ncbi:unnamed protein product, partial [Owenia fusiformis]
MDGKHNKAFQADDTGNQIELNNVYYASKYASEDTNKAHKQDLESIAIDSDLTDTKDTNEGDNDGNCCTRGIATIHTSITGLMTDNVKLISRIVLVILILLYSAYLGYAIYLSPSGAIALIVITVFVLVCLV